MDMREDFIVLFAINKLDSNRVAVGGRRVAAVDDGMLCRRAAAFDDEESAEVEAALYQFLHVLSDAEAVAARVFVVGAVVAAVRVVEVGDVDDRAVLVAFKSDDGGRFVVGGRVGDRQEQFGVVDDSQRVLLLELLNEGVEIEFDVGAAHRTEESLEAAVQGVVVVRVEDR